MTTHYGLTVAEDEDGDLYYVAGHVPKRRALAAANRYARTEQGMTNLYDAHGVTLPGFLRIEHTWWRPDPGEAEDDRWESCEPGDAGAQPFTEIRL